MNEHSFSIASSDSGESSSASSSASTHSNSDPAHHSQLIHRIIYSAGLDHQSHPLIVISASSFPAQLPAHLTLDSLTQQALDLFDPIISSGPYSLIIFASPAEHAPTLKQILSAYRLLTRSCRKNLNALWVVHPTFWAKMTVKVFLKTIVSWKMSRKIKWIKDLSTLASLVPIHQVCIPPEVYKYDLTIEPCIVVPPSCRQPPVFKVSLEQLMGPDGQHGIPQVIQDSANCIRSSGMKFEGLFRRPPSLTTTQIIRDAYDRRQPVKMEEYSDGAFLAASLIKLFLRELPTPIFPADFYPLFRACPSILAQPIVISHQDPSNLSAQNEAVLKYIRENILALLKPKPVFILLDYVLKLCHDLALHSEHNKMDSHNLATCLAPTMIRSSDLMSDAMMCKLPSPSLNKKSPDLGDHESKGPTSFTSILKFMISCYPLLFEEPADMNSPTCSSLSSLSNSSGFKDSQSNVYYSPSSSRPSPYDTPITNRSSIFEGSKEIPSTLLHKLFSARRPLASQFPLRCTISQVGLSHAFTMSDARSSGRHRRLEEPASPAGRLADICRRDNEKHKFATVHSAQQSHNSSRPTRGLSLLPNAFVPLPLPISPPATALVKPCTHSSTSNFLPFVSPSSSRRLSAHSSATLLDPQSRFVTSSDLNELD
ncbi:hypothetical protein PCANC_04629 [Puccinia coronata f. sp. avenae]|uniref:Rho-GAP domain-containing protein n=1 Tax=Puccinia coronata f. sp. avenae TaxID=200324 RepID=A0A2N5W097_9BASI|nr:hypothetical protein PCANC_16739 [Puccinia coronata f. sp. avenae]PLW29052.1 hypothetical protein PCASD_16255 [Puccinia coronata f. sp. avenae]PLW55684.1 hypothetical protein PCANC_04629 [Puccinia coronata f. sp. avenae]